MTRLAQDRIRSGHGLNASTLMRSLPKGSMPIRFSLALLALCLGSSFVVSPASAQHRSITHPTLSYQASINKVGAMTVTARLYSDPSGIDLIWEESTDLVSLAGVIDLELGAKVALPLKEMDRQLYLGISIDGSEELRPLTKLSASPLALTVPDGAITKSKIGASYIESITINGRKIDGTGAELKIETGNGITAGYDEGSNTILLASASTGRKGAGTLANETIDGDLTVNGNTNLGGSATAPTITFTAKAASALNMDGNDVQNVGSIDVADNVSLDGATLTSGGSTGTTGQVLTSQGSGANPVWSTIPASWGRGGSAGTTAGTDFIGTTDDEAFEIHVNSDGSDAEGRGRIARFEPNATSANVIFGHNSSYISYGVVGATISGGGDASHMHEVYMDYGTIGGGRSNAVSQFATVSGGEYNAANNSYATVGGGYDNVAASTNSTIAGGYSNWARANATFIGGGEDNMARGNLSVIGGGYNNRTFAGASTISGGEWNETQSTYATIAGGTSNYADGYASSIGGGEWNTSSGLHSTVGGGTNNSAYGHNSAIPGGRYLRLGGYSFGFNADASNNQTDLSALSSVAYFGNTDVMIGNVDNTARSVRFYEPNSALDLSGANYTSFKSPALSANIEYTLPSSQGASGSVLANNGSGTLAWQTLTLNGDVTGPLNATTVQSVGGQSAASVATAVAAVNAAAAMNLPGTLVLRDANGNFAAGTVTAHLIGNVTGNITGNVTGNVTGDVLGNLTGNVTGDIMGNVTGDVFGNVTGNVTGDLTGNVTGNASTVTNGVYTTGSYADPSWITSLSASKITDLVIDNTSFSGELAGDVTGTQGATVVDFVGGLSASQIATTLNGATSSNTASTLVKRSSSGDVAVGNLSASNGLAISGGVITLSMTTAAASNAGVAIPSGSSIVRITTGTATSNFAYTLPSGTEGQVLYIYNDHGSRRANNALGNIDNGTVRSFIYINGNWIPVI